MRDREGRGDGGEGGGQAHAAEGAVVGEEGEGGVEGVGDEEGGDEEGGGDWGGGHLGGWCGASGCWRAGLAPDGEGRAARAFRRLRRSGEIVRGRLGGVGKSAARDGRADVGGVDGKN